MAVAKRLVFLLLIPLVLAQDTALRCKDHPAYSPSLNPVIISSWEYSISAGQKEQHAYLFRYTGHVYAPVDNVTSTIYRRLDLFHKVDVTTAPPYTMTFQRPARIYMFVNVDDADFDPTKEVKLRGWIGMGWAKLIEGNRTITYGIHQTLTRQMPKYAYVFMKQTNGKNQVSLPQAQFVRKKTSGISASGIFNVWISEADGSPSPAVGKFKGLEIEPNKECPQALHDYWMIPGDDPNDPSTDLYTSYHPAWDPCWGCAYNHEHGSNPITVMGYRPKFTYTAIKNNNEAENDRGFKGHMFRVGNYMMYFSLHAMQSSVRRVKVRFHTVNIAIVDRKTKEVMMDIQHKGDFGFSGVRLVNGRTFNPIDEEQRAIRDAQIANDSPRAFRSINVIDVDNLNSSFKIRQPLLIGQYEEWQVAPICTQLDNTRSLLVAVFKFPQTGIKSLAEPDVIVNLGRKGETSGKFFRHLGMNRSLRAKKITFASAGCPERKDGVFYTDPFARTVLAGPGPGAVRQYIKPGFKLTVDGRFETIDLWNGLYKKGDRGTLLDHGYGIDPEKN